MMELTKREKAIIDGLKRVMPRVSLIFDKLLDDKTMMEFMKHKDSGKNLIEAIGNAYDCGFKDGKGDLQ